MYGDVYIVPCVRKTADHRMILSPLSPRIFRVSWPPPVRVFFTFKLIPRATASERKRSQLFKAVLFPKSMASFITEDIIFICI